MWILKICFFPSASENQALDFIFHKTSFENYKKTGKHCKYFCLFYKNLMSKQRIPPFQTIPLFGPTLPFLEKIFHPHPYCQIKGSQSGGGGPLEI